MKLILSPHTDDAIFSIGEYLSTMNDDVMIASVFAGIPTDAAGKRKHEILRSEHSEACGELLVFHTEGEFLDDVYGAQDIDQVRSWVRDIMEKYDEIYIPIGVHHPDHKLLSDLAIEVWDKKSQIYFYDELPYRILYPEESARRRAFIDSYVAKLKLEVSLDSSDAKLARVNKYESQVDDDLLNKLMVQERIWKAIL